MLQVLSEASILQASELEASNPTAAYKAKLQACKQNMEGKGLSIAAGLLAAAIQGGQVGSGTPVVSDDTNTTNSSNGSGAHTFTPPVAIAAYMVPPDNFSSIECAIQHALQQMPKPQMAPVQHGAEPVTGIGSRSNAQGPQSLAGFKSQQQPQEQRQQHKQPLPRGGAVKGKPPAPPSPARRVTRSASAALAAAAAAAVGVASTAAEVSAAIASAVLPLEVPTAARVQEQGHLRQQVPSSQHAPVLSHKRPQAEQEQQQQQQQHKRHHSSQPALVVGGILTEAQRQLLKDVLEQPARLRRAREQQQEEYQLGRQLRRKPTQDALSCLGRLSPAEQQHIDGTDLQRLLLRSEQALLEPRAHMTTCRAARMALMQHSQDIRDGVMILHSGGSSSGSGLAALLPVVAVVVRRLGAQLPVK